MIIRWRIAGVLALLAALAHESQATCPTGWLTREGYCYFQSTAEMVWNEAESYCQTQYAHLVSYDDAVERDWAFQTFISGSGTKWWIGMNDLANEGTFVWTDPTTTTGREIGLWKIGEPNNDGDEDCITISDEVQQSSNGNWADAQCRKKRRYICKKEDAAVPDCDDANGFTKYGSYCYKYIAVDMSWHDGNDACRDLWNAELTAITSQDEQDFIFSMTQTGNKPIWIGLSDSAVPGTLQWSNGHDSFTSTSYNNWASTEPVMKYPGSTCVQSTITGNGQWSVTLCGETKPVICRKGLRATCPSGWTYAHGKCYEVILNQNFFLTWTEANTYCKAKNARLLEIKTEEEQLFISSYASSFSNEGILQIWLGISDVGHDDVLTWVDQGPVTFEHWDGTPVTRAGQDDCAQVYMGKGQDNWELTTCYSQQSFICEIHEGTPLSNIDTPDIYYSCSKGWRLLPPYCYYFGDVSKNWLAAESFCNDPAPGSGHLASIHNSAQQSFISGHMTSYSWLGLNDRVLEGQYTWTDGTPYNFTNWNSGEPNNAREGEDCINIYKSGTWNDDPCTMELNFACKRDAVHLVNPQPVPTLPPDMNDLLCGDGYIHNPSSHRCYKFVNDFSRSWADARTHCQADGADLVGINSPDEQAFVHANIALSARQAAFWIGGIDAWSGPDPPAIDYTDGGWQWIDGSPFNFVNWNGGEPNNVDNEDCIEMVVSHGYWNDLKCDWHRGYICEKEDPDHATDPPATDCSGADCCYRHLGVEKGGAVKNRQLTASSQKDSASGPDRGRLNTYDQYIALLDLGPGKGGWRPANDQSEPQWIQVDLEAFYEVRGVVTQGLNGLSQPVNQNAWTRELKVHYKTHLDQDLWEPIRDSTGNVITFDGNHDQNTQVTNIFPRPVFATGIRIYVSSCRIDCALRFEVIGCLPQCVDSLGIGVGGPGSFPLLPATSFSASSSKSGFGPEMASLDYSETVNGKTNSWQPFLNDKNQWLQVDLGENRKVSGILLQGNPQASEYVTQYKVQFSNDGSSFTTYLKAASDEQIFPGNVQPSRISEGFFREPLSTRYIRILPQAWSIGIAVRFDVMGCKTEALVTCRDTAEPYPDEFTVDCPAGCDSATDQLYGTGVYTENSYICAAAIHDGMFLADHGGTVDVKKIDGKTSYAGSTNHGLTSKDYGSSETAFIFQGDHLGCPPGWNGWKDWCYYTPRMSALVSWPDARAYCQIQGGDLVSILSQPEQDFVTTRFQIEYSIDKAWIGFNDLDTYNYYQWSDGSKVTYTRWDVNEPNSQHERCVEMNKIDGLWNDQECEDLNNVICKMDKIPVNQEQTVVDGCEAGWIAFEGSCYFIDLTKMVWINSENYCKGVGGHLVAVNNVNENMWLTAMISEATHSSDNEKFWIGLGAYLSDSQSLTYSWSTGEPVSFTAWELGEPDIKHTCSFPFYYEGMEYYTCIEEGTIGQLIGPWCSADPVFSNHPVPCNSWTEGQVGCFRMDSVTGQWSQGRPFACGSDAYKICEKPRVGYTNPVLPTTTHPLGRCPDTYFESSSSYCYQINEKTDETERLNWEDANAHCISQGAQLVSIHSPQEEANIISGMRRTSTNRFWIGLQQSNVGGYSWTDNSPIMYTNWATGEPNNYEGREQCVEAYYGNANSPTWNDMHCDFVSNWICKVLRGTILQTPAPIPQGTFSPQICGYDVNWVAYRPANSYQYCYHFSPSIKGFYEAGQDCRSLGGDLVSVHSRDEQEFLTGRTSKTTVSNYWIGMVQEGYGGYEVWVDGSPVVYTNWRYGEPNDGNGQESCSVLDSYFGVWSDANCGTTYGYICKKLVGATPGPPVPTPTLPGGCPEGWQLYGSKCFLTVGLTDTTMRKTWRDAEAYCNQQGGFLASVPNQYYNSFLISLLYETHASVWIGLNTIGSNFVFTWSDNEAVTFTNWQSNEPNNQGNEECVEMYSNGRWNDVNCDNTRAFMCNIWRSTQYSEPTPDDTGCPVGYKRWDTGCYKLYSADQDQLSWSDARAKCQEDGITLDMTMELTSIWNVYENSFLKSMFWPDADYDYAWIGLYYDHSLTNGQTQFKWSDGSALYYTNWETNQPQQINSETGCVEMQNYGTWSVVEPQGIGGDESCNTKRPFVCKHEMLVIPTGDPGLGDCDPGWVALGDYCYYVRPGLTNADTLSFGDAENSCNQRSGSLVSIHSDIENKAVNQWAGTKTVWLGLKRNAWGGWEWSDGSPVDFTNWITGEPNNVGDTGEQCTEMYNDGRWNDNLCKNLRGYICKKHKSYSHCAFSSSERTDCGYDGINEYECLERGCCWDVSESADKTCYYSREDAQCLEQGGQCKDYVHNVCDLGYQQGLCSGNNDNQCCFTCDPNDQTCNDQVDGWEEGDGQCSSEMSGKCQYNSNYCNGYYYVGYCGGPGQRQCCSPKAPPTDTPPVTELTTTTKPGDTGGKTTTGTATDKPVTTTLKQTTIQSTNGPIDEPTGGGGLSGGAIAGIIIAVLIVVAGAGFGFYVYQRGSMPSVSMGNLGSYVPSFSKKSYETPASFDNPIVFSNDSSGENGVEGLGGGSDA